MGRASRHKHEGWRSPRTGPAAQQRPRWAAAHGFDYAWSLSQAYQAAAQSFFHADGPLGKARSARDLIDLEIDFMNRKLATMRAAYSAAGGDLSDHDRRERMEPRIPSRFGETLDERVDRYRPHFTALSSLASTHLEALTQATPILFDPLAVPDVDPQAAVDLRLPFPVTVCDFLAQSGMSLPVHTIEGREDDWVGVVAATFAQVGPGVLDCWPVVTTLHARERDESQDRGAVMFGRARFGADLPDAPEGMTGLRLDGASTWVISDDDDDGTWARLWITRPALAAASALRLLEAVNVSLEVVELRRPERRRAQREGALPALEVVIRTSARSATFAHGTVDWQHRWTVRGHWKHFRRGPIFDANPRKRVRVGGSECVRVWCPLFVKGPADKPLVLKARRADHPSLSTESEAGCTVSTGGGRS